MSSHSIPFGDAPFTFREARDAGVGRGVLYGPRVLRPFHGVRQATTATSPAHVADPSSATRMLCEQYFPRLRPGQFYSHDTCLALADVPMPRGWQPVVHVSTYHPDMSPRTVGVIGHRLRSRPAASWRLGRLPLEHPARAWVQVARSWSDDDLIVAGDFLIARRRPLVSLEELRAEARLRGASSLSAVLDQVRDGSESPAETRVRLCLVRAQLPEPELNVELRTVDGRLIARLDAAYRRHRVAVEYDGRQHAFDVAQFRRDADRWEEIRAAGWELVRVLDHHLAGDGRVAAERVRAALIRRGWPSQP